MTFFAGYPQWLLAERDRINALISDEIDSTLRDSGLRDDLQRCLLPGRKIRSIVFLLMCREHPAPPDFIKTGIYAIECAQAGSVLVDDILDADTFRHGYLSTQAVWGAGKSALMSHVLVSSALKELARWPGVRDAFISAYDQTCWGELHDVLLVPGDWILRDAWRRIVPKTAALFRFAFTAPGLSLDIEPPPTLNALANAFGALYQYGNDYFDWQPDLLDERHQTDDVWPVTMSLPLILYVERFGTAAIGDVRNRLMNRREWRLFLREIWQPAVTDACVALLENAIREVHALIDGAVSGDDTRRRLKAIANLATTRTFWFHELEVA